LLLILGSTVDRHVEHLDQRWSEACHNAPSAAFSIGYAAGTFAGSAQLWREIQ